MKRIETHRRTQIPIGNFFFFLFFLLWSSITDLLIGPFWLRSLQSAFSSRIKVTITSTKFNVKHSFQVEMDDLRGGLIRAEQKLAIHSVVRSVPGICFTICGPTCAVTLPIGAHFESFKPLTNCGFITFFFLQEFELFRCKSTMR